MSVFTDVVAISNPFHGETGVCVWQTKPPSDTSNTPGRIWETVTADLIWRLSGLFYCTPVRTEGSLSKNTATVRRDFSVKLLKLLYPLTDFTALALVRAIKKRKRRIIEFNEILTASLLVLYNIPGQIPSSTLLVCECCLETWHQVCVKLKISRDLQGGKKSLELHNFFTMLMKGERIKSQCSIIKQHSSCSLTMYSDISWEQSMGRAEQK